MKNMTALIIMDGFGERAETQGNAIKLAGTPNIDKLKAEYPHTVIGASGMDVGLPDGQMGNSEVGHLNIGAGRIVYQELTRITKSIQDGDFFANPRVRGRVRQGQGQRRQAAPDGPALRRRRAQPHHPPLRADRAWPSARALSNVYVHCFMDGRDVPALQRHRATSSSSRTRWTRSASATSPPSSGRY